MTGGGLRVMEAFSVTFIYLFSYRTFYKTINNPQPYTIKEDINYKLKAMDCVKALRTADLRGRVVKSLPETDRTAGWQHRVKKCRFKRGINPRPY